jgi:hypothetical protein
LRPSGAAMRCLTSRSDFPQKVHASSTEGLSIGPKVTRSTAGFTGWVECPEMLPDMRVTRVVVGGYYDPFRPRPDAASVRRAGELCESLDPQNGV